MSGISKNLGVSGALRQQSLLLLNLSLCLLLKRNLQLSYINYQLFPPYSPPGSRVNLLSRLEKLIGKAFRIL